MEREVRVSEAKTHLPQLLDEVERGETIIITRRGRRIARIVPEPQSRQEEIDRAIADLEEFGKLSRDYLKGRDGDRINAVLAAAGYNFGLLLRWLERLLRALMQTLLAIPAPAQNV
jgi:prevent-host-death family protein